MATQVQNRRGTTAQHNTFTGASGEITVDTDKKTVVVHDGLTAGGFPLAPNSAFDAANSKVSSVTGTAGQIFSSGGTTPTINLISSGVTATTYGGATQIPVFAVDSFGRITTASNVAVQGMDYAYANTIWNVANSAFARGNTSAQLAFFRVAANGINLDAVSNADTLTIRSSNNIILIANSTNDSLQITQSPSGVTAGSYSSGISALTVDTYGRITSVTGSAGYVTSSGVTSITAGTGLSGGTITSTGTISMPSVGPGAGSYSSGISAITIDAQGRITAITGSAGYVTSVSGTAGRITSSGGTTPAIDLATSGVAATTYGGATNIPTIIVDAYGRITSASNVAVSSGGVTIGDQTSSSSTFYPLFTTTTSGSASIANVATTKLYFVPSTGTLSATVFNSLSDITFKTDIEEINGIELINKINPISFKWKDTESRSYGVIAQELEKNLPELVETNDQGIKSVSYMPMIAILVDVVKKQGEEIEKLKTLLNNQKVTE